MRQRRLGQTCVQQRPQLRGSAVQNLDLLALEPCEHCRGIVPDLFRNQTQGVPMQQLNPLFDGSVESEWRVQSHSQWRSQVFVDSALERAQQVRYSLLPNRDPLAPTCAPRRKDRISQTPTRGL